MAKEYRKVTRYYHGGELVSMMYHKGKLVYSSGIKPWQAYVQDGLVFQLDCTQSAKIEGSEAIITDLAKGIELRGLAEHYWKNDDGSFTVVMCGNENAVLDLNGYENYTIELYGKIGRGPVDILLQAGTNDGSFLFDGINTADYSGGHYYKFLKSATQYGQVSAYRGYDEEEYQQVSGHYERKNWIGELCETFFVNNEPQYAYIGQTLSSSFVGILLECDGIFSIRIYNRVLSEDERLKNYAIDQRRFVAPPVPENALVDIDGNYILDAEDNFIVDNN